MPFKRLQARGVPLLRDRLRKSASPARVAGFRAVFSNTAVIRHKPASEDTSVSLVHWQEPYSHRGRVLADCSQLPGLRRVYREPPGPSTSGALPHRLGRKVKNSQARTGHQRGMGGRWTDDDDTHERHTDTNRLTRHTASWLPHTLSRRTHNSGPHPPCRPPQHSTVPKEQTRAQQHNRRQEVTCEARAGLLHL